MNNLSSVRAGYVRRILSASIAAWVMAATAPVPANAQTVPASGLVGYWPGNGNANDASNSANNGTFSGAYAAGISGQAFQISTGTYVTIPDISAYTFSDFSVDFWFKGAVGSGVFLGQDDGANANLKWFVDYGYGNAGKFEIHLNGVATAGFYPGNAVTLDNAWHNLAVVKSGSSHTIYYDGSSIGGASASGGTFPDPVSPLIFGFAEGAVPNYTGLMDEVVLYNRALTPSEVAQLAAIPEPMTSATIAALAVLSFGLGKRRRRCEVNRAPF